MSDVATTWEVSGAMSIKNIKPCNGHLLIKLVEIPEETTDSGLVINAVRPPDILSNVGEIVRKGDCFDETTAKAMEQYEVGDLVRIVPACGVRDTDLKTSDRYAVVYVSQIMGIYLKPNKENFNE